MATSGAIQAKLVVVVETVVIHLYFAGWFDCITAPMAILRSRVILKGPGSLKLRSYVNSEGWQLSVIVQIFHRSSIKLIAVAFRLSATSPLALEFHFNLQVARCFAQEL